MPTQADQRRLSPNGQPPRRRSSWWWAPVFEHRPLEHESCVFLLVNLADVVATAWLTHAGGFREANRIAVWVLQHWGWRGLLAYKFGLVAIICLLAQAIARRRPDTARQLLNGASILFAVIVLAAVVVAAVGSAPAG